MYGRYQFTCNLPILLAQLLDFGQLLSTMYSIPLGNINTTLFCGILLANQSVT